MNTNTFYILAYVITAIITVILGIYKINDERKKYNPDYIEGIYFIIIGLTPANVLLWGLALSVLVIITPIMFIDWVLKKILN